MAASSTRLADCGRIQAKAVIAIRDAQLVPGQPVSPRALAIPAAKEEKADDVDAQEPPDDAVDHHHGEHLVDRHHVDVEAKEDKDERQVEPHQQAVDDGVLEAGTGREQA